MTEKTKVVLLRERLGGRWRHNYRRGEWTDGRRIVRHVIAIASPQEYILIDGDSVMPFSFHTEATDRLRIRHEKDRI